VTQHRIREDAVRWTDKDDATLWRWFSLMYDEGRIRWCRSSDGWLVTVDQKHLATEEDFDTAIRLANSRYHSGCRRATRRQTNDNEA